MHAAVHVSGHMAQESGSSCKAGMLRWTHKAQPDHPPSTVAVQEVLDDRLLPRVLWGVYHANPKAGA
jgi:hypothetical protein